MIDYASKEWLKEHPPYNVYDAEYGRKRAIAIGVLQERRIWRGEAACVHVYRNAETTKREGLK